MTNLGLVPLFNFGDITENDDSDIRFGGLFRAGQPVHKFQYDWMRDTLGIDTIINLREEKPDIDKGHGMETLTYLVKDHKTPTDEQAISFMVAVRDRVRSGKKVLIHCEHGHGRTSTFSVLAKIALGWTLEQAIRDERERFHINFNHPVQEQWLREFVGRGEERGEI